MKRIVLMLVAAFLMGGMVMAQHARRSDKMPDPKVRAERMTERMAKEYSLNDTQKKQLLEANMALVERMGDMPMHRRADMKKGKTGCDSCCCAKADKNDAKVDRHHKKDGRVDKKEGRRARMTDEQRAQKKAEMEKKREEMQAARTTYDAQLQKIMTKDQYAAYSKKMQDRKAKMESRRKDARKG